MNRTTDVREFPTVSDDDRAAFGAFLAAARQRSGRSLEEIAGTTKIATRYLQALEHGRVEILPAGMYRRAILRNYAAAIGLDPRVAVERLLQTFGSEGSPERRDVTPLPRGPRATEVTTRLSAKARLVLRSVEREGGKATWPSDRSQTIPARSLVAVACLLAGFFIAQYVTHLRVTRFGLSAVASAKAIGQAAPAARRDVEPSIGTGGRVPIERVRLTQNSTAPTAETNAEAVKDAGEARLASKSQLVITSNPAGARVTVNGIAWGFTPITIRYLPPGDKTIRVTKDGYLGSERRVRIDEVNGTASVQLTLQPRG